MKSKFLIQLVTILIVIVFYLIIHSSLDAILGRIHVRPGERRAGSTSVTFDTSLLEQFIKKDKQEIFLKYLAASPRWFLLANTTHNGGVRPGPLPFIALRREEKGGRWKLPYHSFVVGRPNPSELNVRIEVSESENPPSNPFTESRYAVLRGSTTQTTVDFLASDMDQRKMGRLRVEAGPFEVAITERSVPPYGQLIENFLQEFSTELLNINGKLEEQNSGSETTGCYFTQGEYPEIEVWGWINPGQKGTLILKGSDGRKLTWASSDVTIDGSEIPGWSSDIKRLFYFDGTYRDSQLNDPHISVDFLPSGKSEEKYLLDCTPGHP